MWWCHGGRMRAFCNLMIFSILDNLCIGTVIFTSVFLEVWPFYYPHPLLCSSPTVYQVCSLETLTASPPCFSWFSLLTGRCSASFARLPPRHRHLNRAQSFDLFVSTYTPISLKASRISHVQCFCSNPDLSPAGEAHIQSVSISK